MTKTKRSEIEMPDIVVYHHHHFYHPQDMSQTTRPPTTEPVFPKTASSNEPDLKKHKQETNQKKISKKEWLAQRKKELYDMYKSGQMFGDK